MANDFPISLSIQLREHLRALRKQQRLTQAQLGERIGVSQARIAEIEANPGAVSVEQLLLLLATLGAGLKLHVHAADQPMHSVAEPGAAFIPARKRGSW
jgi:HTH-type transcriptional regulator/antitoxin HipB